MNNAGMTVLHCWWSWQARNNVENGCCPVSDEKGGTYHLWLLHWLWPIYSSSRCQMAVWLDWTDVFSRSDIYITYHLISLADMHELLNERILQRIGYGACLARKRKLIMSLHKSQLFSSHASCQMLHDADSEIFHPSANAFKSFWQDMCFYFKLRKGKLLSFSQC